MSSRATLAIARRVLAQVRGDRRTLALLLAVPPLLVTLLRYVLDDQSAAFDRVGPGLVGFFPFVTMFLVTSITMLRERTGGTLERMMTLPMGKLDVLLGYGLAFGALATVQATLSASVAIGLLGMDIAGPALALIVVTVLNALLGMALGLLFSAFASSEFQAVQFMPAVVFPQLLLCGMLVPRAQMAPALETAAGALPLTYAFDALGSVAAGRSATGDALVVAGCGLAALALGAATLRRRTA